MSVQSLEFLAFLTVTAGSCLLLARRDRRFAANGLALASALYFVLSGGWGAFLVLAAGIAVSVAAVRYLEAESPVSAGAGPPGGPNPAGTPRRRCLVLAAGWHIAVLLLFKYIRFFTGGAAAWSWSPLGLSFFTFQQLWLLKEVYTGQFRLERGDNVLLYAFFFPTVVSGPILKPQAFFPQLRGERFLRPDGSDLAAGLYVLCCGFGKKVLLADNLGIVVANGYRQLDTLTAPGAWLIILGYTLQLYLDFSSYCDIAAGTARLFGIRLPVNFNSPYRSLSVGEFWKRWHMTLTAFLRECLYFPLGGSRKGNFCTCRNILLVYFVSGLWHGAGWTFLIWGGLHGLAQIVERLWGEGRERLPAALRWTMTFVFVNAAWVFFRAPDVSSAVKLLSAAVTGELAPPAYGLLEGLFVKEVSALILLWPRTQPWITALRITALFGASALVALWPRNAVEEMDRFRPTVWRCGFLAALGAWSIVSFTGVTSFIYSNF